MNSFRFLNAGRSLFGTRLLEMSPNTIRRLCKSTKYHCSVKTQHSRAEILNLIALKTSNSSISSIVEGQGEITSELSDLPDTVNDNVVEALRLRGLVAGQVCNLATLRISELGKLNLMSQDKRMISGEGKWGG